MSKGTRLQSFRIDPELWRRFAARATKAGTNRSEILRDFIRWYLGEDDAKAPTRPSDD